IAEACVAFAESHKLDAALGTLLNLADCHAQERRFATARAEFEEAAHIAAQSGQRDRETFAREQLKQLEPVLSLVTVNAAPDAAFQTVGIDGREVAPFSLHVPIALDPGPHDFQFGASGHVPRAMHLDVANGPSNQTLIVPRLDPEQEKPVAPAPVTPSPPKR